MITNLHNIKPAPILLGVNRKGRHIAFVNFNPRPANDANRQNGLNWETDGNRYVLDDYSVRSLIVKMEPELLVKASEDEILKVMTAFSEQDNIDSWKLIRKVQIEAYDSSDAVNQFILNGYGMWLDKATRVGLVNSIQIEKNTGRNIITLWYQGSQFQLPVDIALSLLTQVELYALDCYNVTAKHLADIEVAESVENLQQFDIRADYPQRLDLKLTE